MTKAVTRIFLNKILATLDDRTEAEIEKIKTNMLYISVGTDFDYNHNPVPSYWAEINQRPEDPAQGKLWAKYDEIDEEQYHMWNEFINKIDELSNTIWRKSHAHKSR